MAKRKPRPSSGIRVHAWDVDEGNLAELGPHGIDVELLEEMLKEAPRFKRNKKRRSASHQMIGPDRGKKIWVICIKEVEAGTWRPITGWPARNFEVEWYRRSVGGPRDG